MDPTLAVGWVVAGQGLDKTTPLQATRLRRITPSPTQTKVCWVTGASHVCLVRHKAQETWLTDILLSPASSSSQGYATEASTQTEGESLGERLRASPFLC